MGFNLWLHFFPTASLFFWLPRDSSQAQQHSSVQLPVATVMAHDLSFIVQGLLFCLANGMPHLKSCKYTAGSH